MEKSFFNTLYDNNDFTQALGRLVMSSARFETCLKRYININGKVAYQEKSTLGKLLELLIKNHDLPGTTVEQFQFLLHQRNYFVHKLHIYLSEYPSNEFQLFQFINRANSVSEEMELFCNALEEAAKKKHSDNNN